MKTKVKFSLIFLTVLIITSCERKDGIAGKWSYLNRQNEYAEIWFDGEKVLMLDETSYSIEVLDYSLSSDSLFMTWSNDTIYKIAYKLGRRLILKNDFLEYSLEKFSPSIDRIQNDEEYKNKVYPEFTKRAKERLE
ncbi:MAG: hypothetical protein AAF620_13070 [Bacteroidota bacterium]